MRPPFDPIIIQFAPNFAIHWYGVLIVVGILAGAYYAAWRAKRKTAAGKEAPHA